MERQCDERGRKQWTQGEEQASMKEHTTSKAWFYLALACSFSGHGRPPTGTSFYFCMVADDRTSVILATPAMDSFAGHCSRPLPSRRTLITCCNSNREQCLYLWTVV
jgi:hypothetical protein